MGLAMGRSSPNLPKKNNASPENAQCLGRNPLVQWKFEWENRGKNMGNPWKSSINGGFMAAWENPWENP